MTIRIQCDHCGKGLKAPDGLAGKTASCPNCTALLRIPDPPVDLSVPVASIASTPVAPTRPSAASLQSLQSELSPKPVSRPSRPAPVAEPPTILARGRFFYWLFALSLIPLALSLLGASDDVAERLAQTLKAHPEVGRQLEGSKSLTKETLLSKLPDGKIDGAHLSYDSWMHWLYAVIATAVFFGVIWLIFIPGDATPKQILTVGLATATFGIIFLLGVQWIAAATGGWYMTGASIITLLFYIIKFIGFSYSAAMDPDTGFLLSFLGFTFGVGLCEELTKALPVIFYIRGGSKLDWRGACLWGLASGVGFGIAEGIMYSSEHYNGIAASGTYLVRFVSCVGLHAIWGASVGIMVWRRRDWLQSDCEWGELWASLLYVLAVPMVLHGLYDTMLKKDMQGAALLVAVASFAWLITLTEWTHSSAPCRHRATA